MNHLAQEKSPYLQQHKHNPVNWYPWGEEAFNRARSESKPIFLSIGYSTCYWCHMMERDSFEIQEVADRLNADFICIKVDREERPDVDQIYMEAVMGLTGHGGWPMSVFLTPELKPFFGGTFFWKLQFLELLDKISLAWAEQRDKILGGAEQVLDFLKSNTDQEKELRSLGDKNLLLLAVDELKQGFDQQEGGFGTAPKFPQSERLKLLLRVNLENEDLASLAMVTKTLDKMARGGIYDHLAGGFHRYATDKNWLVPHFEKMLYDNAQLIWTYLEAFQITGRQMFADVARETLAYIRQEMTSTEGGFYSAEDAGEVNKEGEFYVWTWEELELSLSAEELEFLQKTYGASVQGNFENNSNILNLQSDLSWEIKDTQLAKDVKTKLLRIRNLRPRPDKDDKVLTTWNGLMISALAKAFQVLEDPSYLLMAQNAALFIRNKLFINHTLLRRYRENEAKFAACLDDYAFLIEGLLNLYESDFNQDWISWAIELQSQQDSLFWDQKTPGYFYSPIGDTSIILRKKTFTDAAEPSANGISALNLLRLFHLTLEPNYLKKAEALIDFALTQADKHTSAYSSILIANEFRRSKVKEIAILGKKSSAVTQDLLKYLYAKFLPHKVLALLETTPTNPGPVDLLSKKEFDPQKTIIHICQEGVCSLPVDSLSKATELISDS